MITVALYNDIHGGARGTIDLLAPSPLVSRILIVHSGNPQPAGPKCLGIRGDNLASAPVLEAVLRQARTRYLLVITQKTAIDIGGRALERMVEVGRTAGAGMLYSDYEETGPGGARRERPVNDYQPGSIRDDFHFGPVQFFSTAAIRQALAACGVNEELCVRSFDAILGSSPNSMWRFRLTPLRQFSACWSRLRIALIPPSEN